MAACYTCLDLEQKPLARWHVAEEQCYTGTQCGASPTGRDVEGLPGHALESPAALIDSHLPAPALSRRPSGGEGRQRSNLATPRSSPKQPRPSRTLPASTAAQGPCSRREMGIAPHRPGGGGPYDRPSEELPPWLSGLLRANPASSCNGQPRDTSASQGSSPKPPAPGWRGRVVLACDTGRCRHSGVWGSSLLLL